MLLLEMLPLWYSPIYTDGLDPGVRFPRDRYRLVRESLSTRGGDGMIEWMSADPIGKSKLLLAHDEGYCDAFLTGRLDEKMMRRIGLRPWTSMMVERTRILTNGTVLATKCVLEQGGLAGNLGGGTHHAYYDFGSGYCIFNDLAIAARVAQEEHGIERVLILDLDVHQGDGTAAIFEGDASVETVSFHCRKNFPFRKMRSDLDEAFEEGTGDGFYLERLNHFLERRTQSSLPELILFQAGVDSLTTDRLGHLAMTREGLRKRNRMVLEFASENTIPLVITMGGGYGDPIKTSVVAHSDLYLQAAGQIH